MPNSNSIPPTSNNVHTEETSASSPLDLFGSNLQDYILDTVDHAVREAVKVEVSKLLTAWAQTIQMSNGADEESGENGSQSTNQTPLSNEEEREQELKRQKRREYMRHYNAAKKEASSSSTGHGRASKESDRRENQRQKMRAYWAARKAKEAGMR